MKRIVVLISGSGSNLQAIIDACSAGFIEGRIQAVISNKADAFGLERAKRAGIATDVIDHKSFANRESFDDELLKKVQAHEPDLIIMAGFMRILTPNFITPLLGKMINIHPSLLPKYTGLNTHQRAIDAGEDEAGATVHFVTEELDGGPPVLQTVVPILEGDDASALAARVLQQEHTIFPLVAKWFCEGRLNLDNGRAILDGEILPSTGLIHSN
jgi:phosphoribosylglycinamide formyltransferase-1